MEEPGKTFAPELSPAQSRKWMGRLLIAVVLGAAIWNFVATLTTAVVLPGLARVMETDPQSPLSLGKGDFNFPAVFAAILELCFAAIVALVVSSWSQRRPKPARRKAPAVAPSAGLSISAPPPAPLRETVSPAPAVPVAVVPMASTSASPPPPPVPPVTTAAPPPKPPEAAKPAKPKPPKEVYYNIVGEPVERDDE